MSISAILYKKTENDTIRIWQIEVVGNKYRKINNNNKPITIRITSTIIIIIMFLPFLL